MRRSRAELRPPKVPSQDDLPGITTRHLAQRLKQYKQLQMAISKQAKPMALTIDDLIPKMDMDHITVQQKKQYYVDSILPKFKIDAVVAKKKAEPRTRRRRVSVQSKSSSSGQGHDHRHDQSRNHQCLKKPTLPSFQQLHQHVYQTTKYDVGPRPTKNLVTVSHLHGYRMSADEDLLQLYQRKANFSSDFSIRPELKCMKGTFAPNSTAKKLFEPVVVLEKTLDELRNERDAYVKTTLTRLLKSETTSEEPEVNEDSKEKTDEDDAKILENIKRELKRRGIASEEDLTKSSSSAPDPWQEVKEKRRISRRTSILTPLESERRPTYESILQAINNSKLIQHLIDVDNIEEEKFRKLSQQKYSGIPVGYELPQSGCSSFNLDPKMKDAAEKLALKQKLIATATTTRKPLIRKQEDATLPQSHITNTLTQTSFAYLL